MNILKVFILAITLSGCVNDVKIKVSDIKLSAARDSTHKPPPLPPKPTGLQVTAHLLYNDGTASSFDILNDKKIALWNAIGGGGDALKPSESISVDLAGALDSLRVKIRNGRKTVIDQRLSGNTEMEYIIHHTGCELVIVTITNRKLVLYNDTIPFHCGE